MLLAYSESLQCRRSSSFCGGSGHPTGLQGSCIISPAVGGVQGVVIPWVKGSYLVLKFALQRVEGEKREGVKISKQGTQNRCPKKYLQPCTGVQIKQVVWLGCAELKKTF